MDFYKLLQLFWLSREKVIARKMKRKERRSFCKSIFLFLTVNYLLTNNRETLVYIITDFIHRGASEENGGQGRIKYFIFEWFFFFLFPLMLLLKEFKLLWRKILKSCYNAVGQGLSRLFETCYRVIKETFSHKLERNRPR